MRASTEVLSQNILNLKPRLFERKTVGEYLALYTNKMERFESDLLRTKIKLANELFDLIYTIIVVSFLAWQFTIMYVVVGVFLLLVPRVFKSKMSHLQKSQNSTNEDYLKELKAAFGAYDVIFGCNSNDFFIEKINEKSERFQKSRFKFAAFSENQYNFLNSLTILVQMISMFLGGILVIRGDITFGSFTALNSLGYSTYAPLAWIAQKVSIIKSINVVYKELDEYYQKAEKIDKVYVTNIEMKGLGAKYPESDTFLFNNLDMSFLPFNKYLVYGDSGTGKSTLFKILSGFWEHNRYRGCILYDGFEQEFPNVHIVTQNSVIFYGSIKENIILNNSYDEEHFNKVLRISKVDEFYTQDKMISADSNGLSGGQIQRVCIARALYSKSKVIIFDEATTGIHKRMKKEIIDEICKLKDRLFINITHQFQDENFGNYTKVIDWDTIIEKEPISFEGKIENVGH